MWSKAVSWILAALTALFNGFGMYQKEYVPYTGDPAYEVQEEAVDYVQMRTWYIDSYVGSGDVCNVERHSNPTGELNNLGFCYFVAGAESNPDAKNEVSEGSVIIAPARCKVMSNPDTSSDKIVVQNDSGDYTAFKMEISKPGKWFCCQNLEPSVTGLYMHSVTDHKIELNQGDTICVAGPETSIRMWASNESGVLKEVSTIREFLKYDATEKGDSEQIASGGTEKTQVSDLEKYRWQGNMTWNCDPGHSSTKDGVKYDGWWIGMSGDGNWAKSQTVFYKDQYYYMDDDGYMVRGWQDIGSNSYYFYWGNQDGDNGLHPDGSIARSTIVESPDGSGYVYVNELGIMSAPSSNDEVVTVNGRTYQLSGDGTYELLHESSGTSSSNNSGSYSSNTQVGQKLDYYISDSDWESIVSGGYANVSDGWHTLDDDWVYTQQGRSIASIISSTPYTINGESYGVYEISGVMYLFSTESNLLCTDVGVVNDQSGSLYFNAGSNGLIRNRWYQADSWYYADGYGRLWTSANGIKDEYNSNGDLLYYWFNEDGTLDISTDIITYLNGQYKLRGDVEGARMIIY